MEDGLASEKYRSRLGALMARSVITTLSRSLNALMPLPVANAGVGAGSPTLTERLDALADHPVAVIVTGCTWIAAELGGILALLITYW